MKGQAQLIRRFLNNVDWATSENIAYLLYGKSDTLLRNDADWVLTQMFQNENPEKTVKILKNPYKKIYARWDTKRHDKGSHNLDHAIKLRNCLACLVFQHGNGWLAFMDLKGFADADTNTPFGKYYFEMDNGNMNEDKLIEKIKRHYRKDGAYRVIFIKASKFDELEQSRLKKLFEISASVLKGKKGRILGCCYTEFLFNGKIFDHKMREVKL